MLQERREKKLILVTNINKERITPLLRNIDIKHNDDTNGHFTQLHKRYTQEHV